MIRASSLPWASWKLRLQASQFSPSIVPISPDGPSSENRILRIIDELQRVGLYWSRLLTNRATSDYRRSTTPLGRRHVQSITQPSLSIRRALLNFTANKSLTSPVSGPDPTSESAGTATA